MAAKIIVLASLISRVFASQTEVQLHISTVNWGMLRWCWKLHSWFCPGPWPRQLNVCHQPIHLDIRLLFRRYTQSLRRFRRSGAGASCVAFLVILAILKILLVHSLMVLWFWATLERFGCMMHDASKTNMVILCKTLWSLSHEHHIHFIQEMQKNNRWIWRASEELGLTGLTVPIVWTNWKFTCPTKTPLGVSVTDVTVRVTSHPQLSQLPPQPQTKRPRRMCRNGTLFTWFCAWC